MKNNPLIIEGIYAEMVIKACLDPCIAELLGSGEEVSKIIVVPYKIINFVTKSKKKASLMANIPKPVYQNKNLTQQSQGRETERRSGKGDPTLLRSNEPTIPVDRKLGSGK